MAPSHYLLRRNILKQYVGLTMIMLLFVIILQYGLANDVSDIPIEEEPWRGGTILILSDGSVLPQGAPIEMVDENTYVLKRNIELSSGDGIVVMRDSIILNGNGYEIKGGLFPNPRGVYIHYANNVTVVNISISGFRVGVLAIGSNYATIRDTVVSGTIYGVLLYQSNNSIVENNIVRDSLVGINIYWSSYNKIHHNKLYDSGIFIYGYTRGNNIWNNTVDDAEILYIEEASDAVITGTHGQIIIVNSVNITVREVTIDKPSIVSIELLNSTRIRIEGGMLRNSVHGVYVLASFNINITNNKLSESKYCIWLAGSSSIHVQNNMVDRCEAGIMVTTMTDLNSVDQGSSQIRLDGNLINSYNKWGIYINNSRLIRVFNNTLIGFRGLSTGIGVFNSSDTDIVWNLVLDNKVGLHLNNSRDIKVLFNDFVRNVVQVELLNTVTRITWCCPGRGNYWDNHNCIDQNGDNICDNPYVIREPDDIDYYPLRASARTIIKDPSVECITSTPQPSPTTPQPSITITPATNTAFTPIPPPIPWPTTSLTIPTPMPTLTTSITTTEISVTNPTMITDTVPLINLTKPYPDTYTIITISIGVTPTPTITNTTLGELNETIENNTMTMTNTSLLIQRQDPGPYAYVPIMFITASSVIVIVISVYAIRKVLR